ncbi:hypothetical protein TELCIR_23755 [Teladorsagia circumcincta]|uniref:Uncharacterized protein n=1 Tax=Teladorsagia circumcincta TaxID=45464 RepID=A0A2G9TA77_TELCI|nr:hypothetical protein TELCIR_23755 [Teladorsagia circumcincta]
MEEMPGIPSIMLCTADIIAEIFGTKIDPNITAQLCECAISAPKNVHIQHLHDDALNRHHVEIPEDERYYRSVDEAIYPEEQSEHLFTMEYINSLTPTRMPPLVSVRRRVQS